MRHLPLLKQNKAKVMADGRLYHLVGQYFKTGHVTCFVLKALSRLSKIAAQA
jgi:hypothetical protein